MLYAHRISIFGGIPFLMSRLSIPLPTSIPCTTQKKRRTKIPFFLPFKFFHLKKVKLGKRKYLAFQLYKSYNPYGCNIIWYLVLNLT